MFNWLMSLILAAGVPAGTMTLKTAELTILMDSQAGWTIRELNYQGNQMILPAGGQGAVMLSGEKWYGSVMNPAEPEVVNHLSVTVEGREVNWDAEQPKDGRWEVNGSQIKVRKESKIGSLEHTAETTVEKDYLIQHHTFKVTETLAVTNLYGFIYSLQPEATQWLAEPVGGGLVQGEFKGDNSYLPGTTCRWLAQYDSANNCGAVIYFPQNFPGPGVITALWDVPAYHKLLAQPCSGNLPAGTELDLSLAMAFFEAPEATWTTTAAELASRLQQQLPVSNPESEQANQRYGPGVPESGELTLKAGDYTVPLAAAPAWTIKAIGFQDQWPSGKNGFYNTVLIPRDDNFWGTGHSEGGREIVEKIEVTVDGTPRPLVMGQTLTGQRLTVMKESVIWKLRNQTEITLTPDYLLERTRLEALEEIELDLLYYFMHCFVPSTTHYLAALPDGGEEVGELGASNTFVLNKDTVWVAQFEPQWQWGLLCYTPRVISGPGSASFIWDLDRYHKYYLRANTKRTMQQGEKLDYQVIVKIVTGETGDWQATRAAAAELMQQFPQE